MRSRRQHPSPPLRKVDIARLAALTSYCCSVLRALLLAVAVDVPAADIAKWTPEQQDEVVEWARKRWASWAAGRCPKRTSQPAVLKGYPRLDFRPFLQTRKVVQ